MLHQGILLDTSAGQERHRGPCRWSRARLSLTLHMSLSVRSDKRLICLGRNFRLRPPRRLGTGTESAKTSRGEETAQDPRAKLLIQLWFQAAAYRTGSG